MWCSFDPPALTEIHSHRSTPAARHGSVGVTTLAAGRDHIAWAVQTPSLVGPARRQRMAAAGVEFAKSARRRSGENLEHPVRH